MDRSPINPTFQILILKVIKENIDLFRGNFLDRCAPTGGYRILPYHYLMWLNKYAKIQRLEVDASTFPTEVFTFLPLELVPGRKKNNQFYTNVIGRFHSMSNIVIKQVEEHDETKDTMNITIWGELATMIDDGILDSNENAAVIIIVTATFVKERMGLIGLSTTQASRVFVNLDCEQVHQFRIRLGEETGEIEEIHLEQEKDPFEDKISLYEDSHMLMDFENTLAKKYKKQVQKKNGQTTCPKCKNDFDGEVLPWYRITVRIKDNTEYADLTIFGFNVEKMLKYTADEHVAYAERCEKKQLQVFDRLIGEKIGFKLKMTEDNIEK
ncbi:hypothetical protein MKW92_044846 [Papaver armeniacum]|nr:hypothetical protein MKW92_044846 [Papaver armeniacum]